MNETREMTSTEINVLANVEMPPEIIRLLQASHKSIHERRPMSAVHATGADINFWVALWISRWLVRTGASVVIAVAIEDEEAAFTLLNSSQKRT